MFNSLGQQVYNAKEDTDCCTRQCCGPMRPFDMNITDMTGNEVIHLNRPLRCQACCFPCCLQVIISFWNYIESVVESRNWKSPVLQEQPLEVLSRSGASSTPGLWWRMRQVTQFWGLRDPAGPAAAVAVMWSSRCCQSLQENRWGKGSFIIKNLRLWFVAIPLQFTLLN